MKPKNPKMQESKKEKIKEIFKSSMALIKKGFVPCMGTKKRYAKLANRAGIHTCYKVTSSNVDFDREGLLKVSKFPWTLVAGPIVHWLPIWAYLICEESHEVFKNRNGNEYHQLKAHLKNMEKNPYLQLVFLVEYCMDNKNPPIYIDLGKSFIEASKCIGPSC